MGLPAVQISLADDLSRRYDDLIASWGAWRDAQTDPYLLELVDEVFSIECQQLERIAKGFGIDVLPF